MKPAIQALALAGSLLLSTPGWAHDAKDHAPAVPATGVDAQAQPAVAAVEQFSKALQAGDLDGVRTLLADDVLVLESGGAERSRSEYLGGHAIHDAAFLKAAHVEVKQRTARVDGATAWVGTESEVHTSKDGKALTLLSSETMVLKLTAAGWRIVHIHWSSRPKKEDKPASGAMLPAPQQSIATTGADQDVTRGS